MGVSGVSRANPQTHSVLSDGTTQVVAVGDGENTADVLANVSEVNSLSVVDFSTQDALELLRELICQQKTTNEYLAEMLGDKIGDERCE